MASASSESSGPAANSPRPAGRTLVLGLGNPLLSDDGVGPRVAGELRRRLGAWPDVEVDEDYCGGLRLMERLVGYERAIIVDAICSGAPPGTVGVHTAATLATRHSTSAHDVGLVTALELGRQAGAALPPLENLCFVTVEAAQVDTFAGECTPAVAASIGRAAELVLTLLAGWRRGP